MGLRSADVTLETADEVIVRDDLATLSAIIDLSRRARRVVTHNFVIAATTINVPDTICCTAHLALPLGVLGHEGSTVRVGLNGLRLLSPGTWHEHQTHVRPSPKIPLDLQVNTKVYGGGR